jgi:hypothetical protein
VRGIGLLDAGAVWIGVWNRARARVELRNVVVYANIGHSVFSDDGGHFYAGGGFKVVIGR